MDLLVNDLSFHEQFTEISAFHKAFSHLMVIRDVAKRYDRKVHCGRMLPMKNPIPDFCFSKAINSFSSDKRRAAMSWLTKDGPFWDEERRHSGDDWFECGEDKEIVTDSSVGEAAFRKLTGSDCGLISLPGAKKWNFSPVEVIRRCGENIKECVALENWWCAIKLEAALKDKARPIESWTALEKTCVERFENLNFVENCFNPLNGIPFARSSAKSFLHLFEILEKFSGAFNESGKRTEEGDRIYQDHFTGDRALFSDSSEREKSKFRQEMTFEHPGFEDSLFCLWHGKVSHHTLRLHFSWPIESKKPVYIVYAGPKITRR